MPLPEPTEPESPQMDTRMVEFLERRRAEQAQARRQRVQLVAILALGLIAIGLTVSNAVLVSRLVARSAPPAGPTAPRASAPLEPPVPVARALESPAASPAPVPVTPALPPRPAPAPGPPAPAAPLAAEGDPAQRTARWLVQAYGPLDAEGRALAAAEFYEGAERQFWRRVAAQVRRAR